MKKRMTTIIGLTSFLLLSTTICRADYSQTLGDESVYEIEQVQEAGNDTFSLIEYDDQGKPTVSYYRYFIKDGAQSRTQIKDKQNGQNITGNFFNLNEANGAAIYNHTTPFNYSWEIGNIMGDFIGNSSTGSAFNPTQGGAIYNRPINGGKTSIGNITGDFIGNSATSKLIYGVYGGAIYNSTSGPGQTATIGDITGNFIGNHVVGPQGHAYGGAIYNYGNATIGTVSGSFIGNYAEGKDMIIGGAIYNEGSLTIASKGKDIQFSGNYTYDIDKQEKINNAIFIDTDSEDAVLTFDLSEGGNILFLDQIDGGRIGATGTSVDYSKQYSVNIKGNGSGSGKSSILFADTLNNASSVNVENVNLTIGHYDGHVGNFGSKSTSLVLKNTLLNLDYDTYQSLKLNNLSAAENSMLAFGANFNQGISDSIDTAQADGSIGIYNIRFEDYGNVGDKITLFNNAALTIDNLDNYTKIYNNLTYKFRQDGNQLVVDSKTLERPQSLVKENEVLDVQGTVLDNAQTGTLENHGITTIADSSFSNNGSQNHGGVIANHGQLVVKNTDFKGNNADGRGGAIHNNGSLSLIADNHDMLFDANRDAYGSNDIFMAKKNDLAISLVNQGTMTFNGGIDGDKGYTININGDGSGKMILGGSINNAERLNVTQAELVLKQDNLIDNQSVALNNAKLNLANNTIGITRMGEYSVYNSSIYLDVDPAKNVSDIIEVNGDVIGITSLILNMQSSSEQTKDIVFAKTPNDNEETAGHFSIARLVGNPYEYLITTKYDKENKQWIFPLSKEQEPEPEPKPQRLATPEVVAYSALPSAAVEQTRGINRIISGKVAAGKIFSGNCNGAYDEAYNGENLHNVWVDVDYLKANFDRPADMDADIWGITGGFDIQTDAHNKLGVFASYRQGEYDLSGRGRYYSSTIGSKIDIDSYLSGLYYRHDKNSWYVLATAFSGTQKADIKTNDGIIKTEGDADQLGASLESGYVYGLTKTLSIEPGIGIFYSYLDYEDINDQGGKTAKYDTINYFEAEAGIKLEKTFHSDESIAKVYVRPSIVQTFGSYGDIHVTGLQEMSSLRDQTLGRVELGGRYGLGNSLSFYGWSNYTFGNDYDAAAFGLGLTYVW